MILSHRHRFIFIKTLKTAGTSIEVSLARYCGPEDIITPVNPPVEGHSPRNFDGFYNHIGAGEIRRLVGPELWAGYTKFTFERNPWDKVVSYYHWARARGHRFSSFDDFLLQCVKQDRFPLRLPSSRELYEIDGELAVDRVGFFESLERDLGEICATLGVAFDGWLPREKAGLRPQDRSYAEDYTPASRATVALHFAKEIRRFGYRFAPDSTAGAEDSLARRIGELAPALASAIPRSRPCPCGSGLKFRSCHGALQAPLPAG